MEKERKTQARQLISEAKHKSGKTYGQIAEETGLTNVYVAQLLSRQAQLKPETAPKLRAALPELTEELIHEMMRPPMRSYDPDLIQEPTVYRLNEAVMHFGESIKEIINEEFGDGIMSAIDFYCSVDKVKGVDGKDRVVLTFDGKYLPYTEQMAGYTSSTRLNLLKDVNRLLFGVNCIEEAKERAKLVKDAGFGYLLQVVEEDIRHSELEDFFLDCLGDDDLMMVTLDFVEHLYSIPAREDEIELKEGRSKCCEEFFLRYNVNMSKRSSIELQEVKDVLLGRRGIVLDKDWT